MPQNAVTGAFSYTGKYITQRLLDAGEGVCALTGHPDRPHSFGDRVPAHPLNFDAPNRLAASLHGVATLYNTYWIRFSRGTNTYARAIENTGRLIAAAEEAGVERIIHISISNPSEDSPLPYFKGKADIERIVRQSRLSYGIIRPTLVFGFEDILINNIAWFLRRFPVFPIATGNYRVQPVFVGDVADLAVRAGHESENTVRDAAGPEVFTYAQMVRALAEAVGSKARTVPLPPRMVHAAAWLMGLILKDVVLTWDEVRGLRNSLLISHGPAIGVTPFSDWTRHHCDSLGRRYSSELRRHYDRPETSGAPPRE